VSLSEDEVRHLLRECVTVVRPGEVLILRVGPPGVLTPNQLREYQESLNWWLVENAPGIKALAVIGENGQIVRQEPEVFHQAPPDGGGGLMPCCGKTPFEVPGTDRMTADPALVTCMNAPPSPAPGRAIASGAGGHE
jgi:hypothetical protein